MKLKTEGGYVAKRYNASFIVGFLGVLAVAIAGWFVYHQHKSGDGAVWRPATSPTTKATETAFGASQAPTQSPEARSGEKEVAVKPPETAREASSETTLPPSPNAKVNSKDGLTYVWIPPGTFQMGCSPDDSDCSPDEKPPHSVTITNGFWLGQTPVTRQAYQKVTGQNPSDPRGSDQLPVENVSWDDANSYCRRIGGRLPTEAEWEYAARAGTKGARYGELDRIAWYDGNSDSKTHETHEVGQKQANAFGLYDMLGNVWEWTADWYGEEYYQTSDSRDPAGPPPPIGAQQRVVRGGSPVSSPSDIRVSRRYHFDDVDVNGFRCARE